MNVLRIWDLRRGDYDDNRSSPTGGSLRSLLLSTVLEFNYLKAPLAFMALVVAPALVVGVVPSVVITYGRLFLDAVARGRTSFATLALLVILFGAALWMSRPLLTAIFVTFRHLNYTLVFPIFVAVRELVRTLAERCGRPSITPEQLDRRRRTGAVLAALVFVGAGLALALTVEFSIGLKLMNVERVRMWPAIKAALANAAVILGLSTVFESLYWLGRELSVSGPVLDWVPDTSQNSSPDVRVAHLSDLHLVGETYGYRMEAGADGPRGNHCFRNALRKLAAIDTQSRLDRVLVTGDITDAGTRAEWAAFIDLLRGYPQLRTRFSFVPGNHDVNIVDRTNPARLDLPWSVGQSLRKLRVVLALDAIQGARARVVDRDSGALGPSLSDYLREGKRPELLRSLAQRGAIRGRIEMARVWSTIFPLVEPASSEDGCGLVLLESNASSHFSLTNAIGVVDPSQLKALKSVLRNSPRCAWMILLHHQVVEYPVASIPLRDRIGLALINAPDVLAAIAPYASRVIILHGHRHRDWIGTCGEVVLCSAPSVSLGSEGAQKYHGCFRLDELAFGPDGMIRLTASQRVHVS
jgi:3',5'-cyclic AMP phosphodiesterase CpdA